MKTYCNPLPMEDIPEGRSLDMALVGGNPELYPDYRSVSDPGVIYDNGKWYLFPSYSVVWVSEDFVHWKHVDLGLPCPDQPSPERQAGDRAGFPRRTTALSGLDGYNNITVKYCAPKG